MNKWIRYILLVLLSSAAVILDASFFSYLSVGGVSVLSSLSLFVIFALLGRQRDLLFLSVVSIFLLAAFSSLPVWFILFGYLFIPSGLMYVKVNHLHDSSLFMTYLLICLCCFTFEVPLLMLAQSWDISSLRMLGYFILLNSSFTMLFFYLVRKTREQFTRGEIKI
jgi:hypothetical protein